MTTRQFSTKFPKKYERKETEKKRRKDWQKLLVLLLFIVVFRAFAWEPFRIPSSSMEPTLLVGDYVLVAKYAYGYSRYSLPFALPLLSAKNRIFAEPPKRGDVVVFRNYGEGKKGGGNFYIKRIVGLPGDKVKLEGEVLRLNGKTVPLSPLRADAFVERLPQEDGSHRVRYASGGRSAGFAYKVPPGHVFVLGDNRDNSVDSRFRRVGFIPLTQVVGRAEAVMFSFKNNPPFWRFWELPFAFRPGRFAAGL